jgi:hypothetical protein
MPSRTARPPHTTGSQTALGWAKPARREASADHQHRAANALGETWEMIFSRTTLATSARPTATTSTTRPYSHRPTQKIDLDLFDTEEVVLRKLAREE